MMELLNTVEVMDDLLELMLPYKYGVCKRDNSSFIPFKITVYTRLHRVF